MNKIIVKYLINMNFCVFLYEDKKVERLAFGWENTRRTQEGLLSESCLTYRGLFIELKDIEVDLQDLTLTTKEVR